MIIKRIVVPTAKAVLESELPGRIVPVTLPNIPPTTVLQKLKNTIAPKQNPVTGPPYLAQKLTASKEFLAPS